MKTAQDASSGGQGRSSDPQGDPRELLTIESAAKLLELSEPALRARCRRAARREGQQLVARLGAGVVAYKFGKRTWRICFYGT